MSINFCSAVDPWPVSASTAFVSYCFVESALAVPFSFLLFLVCAIFLGKKKDTVNMNEKDKARVKTVANAYFVISLICCALSWIAIPTIDHEITGAFLLRTVFLNVALFLSMHAARKQAIDQSHSFPGEFLIMVFLALIAGVEALQFLPLSRTAGAQWYTYLTHALLVLFMCIGVVLRAVMSRVFENVDPLDTPLIDVKEEDAPAKQVDIGATLKTLKLVVPYFWPKGQGFVKFKLVICILIMLSGKAVNFFLPLLYKRVIDALSPEHQIIILPLGFIFLYGGLGIVVRFFQDAQTTLFLSVSKYATRSIVVKVFNHVTHLSLRWHLHRKTGALLRTVNRGANATTQLLNILLFTIVPTGIELLVTCISLAVLFGGVYALIALAAVVIYALTTFQITKWRKKYRRLENNADNEASQVAVDALLNYETCKYFTSEEFETARYGDAMENYLQAQIVNRFTLLVLNGLQWLIRSAGTIAMLALSGNQVVNGTGTVGDLIAIITYLNQLYVPLGYLGSSWNALQNATTDMEQVFLLLEHELEIDDEEDAPELDVSAGGSVEFEHVSFSYGERRVLSDISFKIPAGESLALVGPSGGGKTTLFRLLVRLYDPEEGTVYVDGQDIRRVTQRSLRANIGVVPQDTVLFNNTIEHNIAYGVLGQGVTPTHAQVVNAAERAQISEFIARNPEGYQTKVGERGLRLSGGEKQRVAIARVLLQNPKICIMDEATSALDTATESQIQAQLEDVAKERTTLFIAHRLSTVQKCDQILVLSAGRIAERGTHAELLKLGGEYYELWQQQLEDAIEEQQAGAERELAQQNH